MARSAKIVGVSLLVAAVTAGWASGCMCGSVDCAGAAVSVDLGATSDAAAAQVCVNGTCEFASETSFDDEVEVRFDSVPFGVRDNEDFELEITVFNEDGTVIASTAHTRNFDVDECRCLSFPYRLEGSDIKRSD